jgi:hypothetical protein
MSCSGTVCYGNNILQTAPAVPLVANQWQEVIFRMKANTPGLYDGNQAMWINGQKKIDMQNMRWRTTTDLRLNELALWIYMPGAPITEHIWFDNIVVWTPGP